MTFKVLVQNLAQKYSLVPTFLCGFIMTDGIYQLRLVVCLAAKGKGLTR